MDNQIEIPQSFMAMYLRPGSQRPSAAHEVVLRRYELCEDLACILSESAHTTVFKENISEQALLMRCHQGLMTGDSAVTPPEADWVVRRLAELLDWEPWNADDASPVRR